MRKKGSITSEETKRKISRALKGRKPKNLKQLQKNNIGKKRTEESKRKMSEAHKGIKLSKETRKNMSKAQKNRAPCSEVTRKKLSEANKGINNPMYGKHVPEERKKKISERHKGSNNNNWKGGITPIDQRLRNCLTYIKWRTNCFKRDNYTCQNCGDKKGGNLRAHHIIHFSKLMEWYKITTYERGLSTGELWNTNNGITLCESCHYIFHGKQLANDFNELEI